MLGLRFSYTGLLVLALSCVGCQSDNTPVAVTTDISTPQNDNSPQPDIGEQDLPESESVCIEKLSLCLSEQKACVRDEGGGETCSYCPKGQYASPSSGQCIPIEGTPLVHDFTDMTLAPGEEIASVCQTWILNNAEELWVHAVEFENGGGYHHSNWIFVPEGYNGWKTDPWPNCYAEGFNEGVAGLIGGVLFAQSTQVESELQKFRPGAAIRIPPYSQIMAPTHLLNYKPEALTTHLRLTIYTVPADQVQTKLTALK